MNNQSDKVKELVGALGAISEMLGQLKKNLKANGFSDEEALYLCNSMLTSLMGGKSKGDETK